MNEGTNLNINADCLLREFEGNRDEGVLNEKPHKTKKYIFSCQLMPTLSVWCRCKIQ
jgi:hypothetical protein